MTKKYEEKNNFCKWCIASVARNGFLLWNFSKLPAGKLEQKEKKMVLKPEKCV